MTPWFILIRAMKAETNTLPREEFTFITIDVDGKWFNKEKQIINEDVLAFFKKNLHRDNKGIYIYNTFKGFSEKGYVIVNGPVCRVTDYTGSEFILETSETIARNQVQMILFDNRLFIEIPRLKAMAIFERNLFFKITEKLVETDEGFFIEDSRIIIKENLFDKN